MYIHLTIDDCNEAAAELSLSDTVASVQSTNIYVRGYAFPSLTYQLLIEYCVACTTLTNEHDHLVQLDAILQTRDS